MYKILFKDKEYSGSVILHVKGKVKAQTIDGIKIDVYEISEEEYKKVNSNKDKVRLSDDYQDIIVGNNKFKVKEPKKNRANRYIK